MLEPQPVNDDVFLEERKKTNQYKNKKNNANNLLKHASSNSRQTRG